MALIIKADGKILATKPANGRDFQLDEIKTAIGGGYMEIVRLLSTAIIDTNGVSFTLKAGSLIVVDSDGIAKQLRYNQIASAIYRLDPLYGDVLICHASEIK